MSMKTEISVLLILVILAFSNCNKGSDAGTQPPPTPPASPTILKDASSVPVGVGISYSLMKSNTSYSLLVKSQFDRVTAEYQMKHAPNVKNDGSFDFMNTDDFVNMAQTAGLTIHGHTLAWHQNNNGTYLRSLTGTTGPNLVLNP
jgi:endo-1,4-beta-xylanase